MLCKYCHKQEINTERSSCKCSTCLDKCLDSQKRNYQNNREKILDYQSKYYQEHKQQVLDYHRKYYLDNYDSIREKQKSSYMNPENHAKALQSAKEYMNANKEKVAEIKRRCAKAKPEYYRQKAIEWRQNHPERFKELQRRRNHRRRAKSKENGGMYTESEWENLKRVYNYRCLCCENQLPLEVDHIVPVMKNGTNDISNIQPLCRSCNAKKSAKIIDYRWDVT
jgi:hypothetical protein